MCEEGIGYKLDTSQNETETETTNDAPPPQHERNDYSFLPTTLPTTPMTTLPVQPRSTISLCTLPLTLPPFTLLLLLLFNAAPPSNLSSIKIVPLSSDEGKGMELVAVVELFAPAAKRRGR